MEDYTLDLRKGHEAILGSHMLEVDPTLASDKPKIDQSHAIKLRWHRGIQIRP